MKRQEKVKEMMSDAQAIVAISEFMQKQNRPFSVQNMIDNLQGRIKMNQTKKIADELTEKKVLTCKEYGKAKIYLINQDLFPNSTNEELAALDEQIKVRKEELDGLNKELGAKQDEVCLLYTSPSPRDQA